MCVCMYVYIQEEEEEKVFGGSSCEVLGFCVLLCPLGLVLCVLPGNQTHYHPTTRAPTISLGKMFCLFY